MLVYIPAKIDGEPFTINKLREITKLFFPINHKGCHIWHAAVSELGNRSIKSHWVLMTKDVLPGSTNKSYVEQQKIVTSLTKGYEVPDLLVAATCILTQYFASKTRLFNNPPTYTRCKEIVRNSRIIIGGFSRGGLKVASNIVDWDHIGVAAIREFTEVEATEKFGRHLILGKRSFTKFLGP